MKGQKLLTLLGSVCLVLVLAVMPFMAACAPEAPPEVTPPPEEEVTPPPPEEEAPALPDKVVVNSVPKGTQYVQACALAAAIEKHTSMKGFAEPTKSFMGAIPLFREDKLDLIFVSIGDLTTAIRGTEKFEDIGATSFRVAALGTGIMGTFFTSPATGIKEIPDLADKKVMYLSAAGGAFNDMATLIVEYYDLKDKIIEIPSTAPSDRAEALKTGKIDAYYCSTQYQAMEIIHSSCGMVMLEVPQDCIDYVHSKYPAAVGQITPKGYNGGMVEKDTLTIGLASGIFCRTNLEDNVVYAVLEAVYDYIEEFQSAHPDLAKMKIDTAVDLQSTVPYHPGAIKFFTDRGVWTEEAEEMQQRLLKELEGITYE